MKIIQNKSLINLIFVLIIAFYSITITTVSAAILEDNKSNIENVSKNTEITNNEDNIKEKNFSFDRSKDEKNSVYDRIESILRGRNDKNEDKDKDTKSTSTVATTTPIQKETPTSTKATSSTPTTTVVTKVQTTPKKPDNYIKGSQNSVVLVKPKKSVNIIYNLAEKLLPNDPYISSGLNPYTTYTLYGLSVLSLLSGSLLIFKRPMILSRRIESVFNFQNI